MTLEEVDELLTDWQKKLRLASDNLMALTELITYQRLRGEGGWPRVRLQGMTQAQVAPALEEMHDLWSHYCLLTDVVKRATELRATVSRLMPSRATLEQIEHLLRGPSIQLPATALPLEQRSLLTAAEVTESVTPERLLEAMRQSFHRAREAVVAVDQAWDRQLAMLAGYDSDMAELQELGASLGERSLPELTEVRQRIGALRTLVEHDPLAADAPCAEIASCLKQARARLEQAKQDRVQVHADLAEARRLWQELQKLHAQSQQTYVEREHKVQVATPAEFPKPLEDEVVAALGPWLTKLETTLAQGQWKPAKIGVGKWKAIARQYLAAEEAARAMNEAPLRERRDLRGLLDALTAKAHACGRGEDAELAALGQEAWQLLHSRPTPLARVRELVAEYQVRLL